LLALDPIFEGGRKGRRARAWDVEDELIGVALLGDVTIDLSDVKSAPAEIEIAAYALIRDVDVIVPAGARVEMFGRALLGDLQNEVATVPQEQRDRVVRIHGHALLGDVTARTSDSS
jgi:predicted membrane protein